MNRISLFPLQMAALAFALMRGLGEFAALQTWRLRDRLARRA